MNKVETITILGHEIKYINETGDTIDKFQIEEQLDLGDSKGTLFMKNMILPIGRWWTRESELEEELTELKKYLKATLINRNAVIEQMKGEVKEWKTTAERLYSIVDQAVKTKLVVSRNEQVYQAMKMYEDAKGK